MLPAYEKVNKESEVDKLFVRIWEMIGQIHLLLVPFMLVMSSGGAFGRQMHIKVYIGLDIAHFPCLMYYFIMQQFTLFTYIFLSTPLLKVMVMSA